MGDQGMTYYYGAGIALMLSALSDLFDGYFARKLNQITELGKLLDPIADKLTLAAVVVCMWIRFGKMMFELNILFSLLLLKEVLMAIGGIVVFRGRKEIIPAQWWGKIGTVGFYACMLGVMLVSSFFSDYRYSNQIIVALVALSVVLMLFAFVRYLIFGIRVLKEGKAEKTETGAETA